MKRLLIGIFLFFGLASFGQTNLTFTQMSSTPDFSAPGRGAEEWGDAAWDNSNSPYIPAGNANPQNKYARFNWIDIENVTQGSYDWSIVDARFNDAIDHGQMLSFGIMPMCTACDIAQTTTYPLYLHTLMQAETTNSRDWLYAPTSDWVPNWNSPNWIARWKALLTAFAAHVNTTSHAGRAYKDIIYYVDVRGYGDFGEWHTYPWYGTEPTGRTATSATLDTIIMSHINAFPNYPLMLMTSVFDHGNAALTPLDVSYFALTRTNAWGGLGIRRDNWGDPDVDDILYDNPYSYNPGDSVHNFKYIIRNKWKVGPIGGEPNNVSGAAGNPYNDLLREVNLYHATSFGNGNWGGADAGDAPFVANVIASSRASGYRITLDSGKITSSPAAGGPINISLYWKNTGIAPVYENWNVTFELRSGATVVWSGTSNFNPKLFLPRTTDSLVADNLLLSGVAPGTYSLYLKIKDPLNYKDPLPLAIAGRGTDGAYLLKSGYVIQDLITLIVIQGESTAAGNAENDFQPGAISNPGLSTLERSTRSGVKIWNHNTAVFESIHVPFNTEQDTYIDTAHHGIEVALTNEVDSGKLRNPTYLLKIGVSGAYIGQWLTGGQDGTDLWLNYIVEYMDPAVAAVQALGKPYQIVFWQSIGQNDKFGGHSPNKATFITRMNQFKTNIRSRYGIPGIKFYSTNPDNPGRLDFDWGDAWATMAAADVNFIPISSVGTTYVDTPAAHWDQHSYRILAQRFVDKMNSTSLPSYTCQTYAVGTPGSSVSLTAMGSYKPCDVIKINTGTYTSATFTHLTGLEITSQDVSNPVTFQRLSTFSDDSANVFHDLRWVSDLKSGNAWTQSGGKMRWNEYYNIYWRDWPSSVITKHNNIQYDYIYDSTAISHDETYHDYIVDSCGQFMQGSFGDPNSGGTTAPDVDLRLHLYNFQDMATSLQGGNGQGTGYRGICYECLAEDGWITDRSGRGADGDVGYLYGHGGWHLYRIHKWGGPGYIKRVFVMSRRGHPWGHILTGSSKFNGTQYGFDQMQFNGNDTLTGVTYGESGYTWSNTFGKQFNDTLNYWSSGVMGGQTCPGCHWYVGDNLFADIGNNIQRVSAGGLPNNGKRQPYENIGGWGSFGTDTAFHNLYAHDFTLLFTDSTTYSYTNRTGTYYYHILTSSTPSTVRGAGVANPIAPGLIDRFGHGYNSPVDLGAFQFFGSVPPLPPSLKPKRGLRIRLRSLP